MELPEIPINKDVTYLGLTTFRDRNQLFGIKRKDRRQHVYILGKSGTGKSVLMFNMIIQNIQNGEGVCVVDPHGELVEGVLSAIPKHRMKDVIYFNPADADHHVGFNVLELIDPQYKHLVASGLMGIFTKIWANAWSARMEYILNNCILALLDTPGTTLLGIPRMLVDKDYRQKIILNLKDPVIKAFWIHEYEAWQDKFRNEAIAPIQNKVGQFLSTSIIRNVVGQSKSTINIFDIMNKSKIFLVNVSKGRIGEDNSALLGGMIITKIQLAAMERVRIPEENRKDFYLYVDEFQNFVTDAFAGILSEARKYRLNLTVAHQYTAQLISDKSSAVRDAVFGNVGTMIVFRVGSDDADFLEKEFDPEFTPQDIVNLPNYKIYLKLMIDGVTSRPFSAKTLPQMVKSDDKKIEEEVIKSSRALYCKSKEVVEREINDWSGMSLGSYVETTSGGLEKFPIICSFCKKETSVPFKPESGRTVYCKDCIAKIKSGEIKVEKISENQIKHDESKFFKPLADLGIEFKQKNGKTEEENRYQERGEKDFVTASKPSVFKSIKKVFTKSEDNLALKEVLNKINEPVSLDSLKDKVKEVEKDFTNSKSVSSTGKDRAASPEDMNKLKDLIHKTQTTEEPVPQKPTKASPVDGLSPREIPEDVLRKILE
ncbi:MAG: CxxC-x17-CxxC domain-containing protein [Candidatus Paceibacterota bacterium]